MSFNAGAFGDVFMNTFLSGLIEIPANLLCYICLDKIGRRWPNGGTLLLAAVVELSLVPILLVRPGMCNCNSYNNRIKLERLLL